MQLAPYKTTRTHLGIGLRVNLGEAVKKGNTPNEILSDMMIKSMQDSFANIRTRSQYGRVIMKESCGYANISTSARRRQLFTNVMQRNT